MKTGDFTIKSGAEILGEQKQGIVRRAEVAMAVTVFLFFIIFVIASW